MYRRSMIFFCAMILVLCSTMAAQSAEREMAFKKGSFYLTPTAGAFINLGSEVVPITNPGSGDPDKFGVGAIMGGRVGYFLTEHFSLEASFEYTWLDAQTTTYNLPFYTTNNHQNVWLGMVNVLYYFEPIFCDNLSPFLLAGVGVDSFAPGISGGSYDVGFAGQYGAGLEYSLTDLLSLRWEVRNLLTTNPQSNNLITTVGVGLHFGGESDAPPPPPPPPPLDSDGDGVPDDRDECPGTAPGQEVDETGCPYLDESGVIYEMPLDGAVQRGIVFDFNKAGQVRVVAVHAVNAFQHDQHPFEIVPLLNQNTIQGGKIVVREGQTPGTGKRYSLQDTVMDEFIVKDEVSRAEQMANGCDVGCMSTNKNNGFINTIDLGYSLLQFPMNGPFPGHNPTGGNRCAVVVDSCFCGFYYFGVA